MSAVSPFSTHDWSSRLDAVDAVLESAAQGEPVSAVELGDLGPIPPELRERAAALLAQLNEVQDVVGRRLDTIDRSLRLGASATRPRGDLAPAPAYLDQRA